MWSGFFDVLAAVIATQVGGDEFFVVIEQQLVWIDFEGQRLGGVEVRQARNCSMPSERINSTYRRRLKHRTMTKKLKRRLEEPTVRDPKLPQSTWAHSPAANSSIRKAGLGTGRTR